MRRRRFLAWLAAAYPFGVRSQERRKTPEKFPPVPSWRPSFDQPLDAIADRLHYYSDNKRDFVLFQHGTCAIVSNDLSKQAAEDAAIEILSKIFHFHPDMNPATMDDGNVLVRYNHPAFNVVLTEIALKHWAEIQAHHLDGLTTSEVLITPLGRNVFDNLGKKALLGRCYMFMDAQSPVVVGVERRKA